MNHTQRTVTIIATLLLIALAATFAYNAGVSQGIAQSGKIVAPAAGAYPYPYPYPYYGWHPFGFGFFLFPLFGFALFFFVIRGLFWRGGHYRHHCGYPHERMTPEEK